MSLAEALATESDQLRSHLLDAVQGSSDRAMVEMLRDYLKADKSLTVSEAKRFGMRFARDAPEFLSELDALMSGYDDEVRHSFRAGAERRLGME